MAIATRPVAAIERAVRSEFSEFFIPGSRAGGLYSLGIYNRRYIAGTKIWSQHSWGNAWDIGIGPEFRSRGGLGDRVAIFLRDLRGSGFPVGTVLWRVASHYDHIHVEGRPKMTGVPPLKPTTTKGSGMLRPGDKGDGVSAVQKALKIWSPRALPEFGIDGSYGKETQEWVGRYQAAAGIAESVVEEGSLDGLTASFLLTFDARHNL